MKKSLILKITVAAVLFLVCVCLLLGGKPGKTDFRLREQPLPTAHDAADTTATATAGPAPTETEAPEPVTEPETEPTEPFQMPEITWKTFPEGQTISAKKAFVYDCQSETYLYTKGDPTEKLYIASITKLFAIDTASAYLTADREVQVTSGPLSMLPGAASLAGLQSGNVLTVSQLYGGILLPSGNDAAYVLAAAAGREIAGNPELSVSDAVRTFVEEMNRRVGILGLKNTHFENPVGFHSEDHYTCFDDLVTISKHTLENESAMQYAGLPKTTVTPVSGSEKTWQNTNALVNPGSQFYCPYAIGLKTGHTIAADYCLLAVFDIDGHRYIVGVFGCPGYNGRYNDALLLFNTQVIGQNTP